MSAAFVLVAGASVSKVLGLCRDILLAKYFGAGHEVDAFLLAITLPLVLAQGVGVALSTALIPCHRQLLTKAGEAVALRLLTFALVTSAVLSCLLMIPLCLAPQYFVSLAAPSFSPRASALAAELMPWLTLYALAANLLYLLTASYHTHHHFKTPVLCDLVINGTLLLSLLLLARSVGIHCLLYGYVCAGLLGASLQISLLGRHRLLPLSLTIDAVHVKSFAAMALPVLACELTGQSATVIEKYFASGLPQGSISALTYAQRLSGIILSLGAVNLSMGVFPTLSDLHAKGNGKEAGELLAKLSRQMMACIVPLAVFLVAFREEIVKTVFMRGEFGETALSMTQTAFGFYAGGLIVAVQEPVLVRSCFAFSRHRTVLLSAPLGMVVILVLNYFLTPIWGIAGIALAMNCGVVARTIVQAVGLRREVGVIGVRRMLRTFCLALLSCLIALQPSLLLARTGVLLLAAAACTFFVCYCLLARFLLPDEFMAGLRWMRQGLAVFRNEGAERPE
jgi:putative peptidoglycan lipid II flippase